MSDLRTDIIVKIEALLVDTLSSEQIAKLDTVLMNTLNDYEIENRCTEVSIYDDTNDQALKFFLQLLKLNGKSDGTINQYKNATEKLLNTIGKPYKEISSFDVRKYFAYLFENVSDVTYNNYITYNNQFFSWLSDEGYIQGNPMKKINRIKTIKKNKQAFSDSERDCLRDNATCLRDKALITFLYSTGVRVGECVSINRHDIHNDEIVVYGQKGKEYRTVYLDDSAKYYLNLYLDSRTDDNPALFVSQKPIHGEYQRITTGRIEKIIKNIGDSCGVSKAHPHRFRRTLCTNLLSRGVEIQNVMEILGHKEITTTELYNDISKTNIKYKHNLCV